MTETEQMHKAIASAITQAMQDNPAISPSDVLSYFEQCVRGLRVTMAFQPSRETFLANLQDEQ